MSLVTITDVVFTAVWALPRVDETHGGCHLALQLTGANFEWRHTCCVCPFPFHSMDTLSTQGWAVSLSS